MICATFGAILGDIMANEIAEVFGELGGEDALGRVIQTSAEMMASVREGFQHAVVPALLNKSGLTLKEVTASLDLHIRSLQRRKQEGRLARYESDRLYRLARILVLADRYIGGQPKSTIWIRTPNAVLGGVAPLALLDTELGTRQVENVLGRIAYGGIS